MEKAPALEPSLPIPLYESCMVAFYRGWPAPGAPMVPTPLSLGADMKFKTMNISSKGLVCCEVGRRG